MYVSVYVYMCAHREQDVQDDAGWRTLEVCMYHVCE